MSFPSKGTHRDDVECGVANLADFVVVVVHEVDEVGGHFGGHHHVGSRRLVASHLVENVHDLQHNLVVFLFR